MHHETGTCECQSCVYWRGYLTFTSTEELKLHLGELAIITARLNAEGCGDLTVANVAADISAELVERRAGASATTHQRAA